jgi:predicted CxxxxCH...CXXCH cytochrome family protein
MSDYTTYTCSNVDCHMEVATSVGWYGADQTANADCTFCHTGISTHITGGCVSCHPGGAGTNNEKHTAQSGGTATVVFIPVPSPSWDDPGTATAESLDMRARLGRTYAAFTEPLTVNAVPNTPYPGIHLGGDGNTDATEADICWNCHGAPTDASANPDTSADNSEWGYNFDPDGATWPKWVIAPETGTSRPRYNYGYLYDAVTGGSAINDWTNGDSGGGFRRNAYQHDITRMSKQIFSVHSANVDDQTDAGTNRRTVSSVNITLTGTSGDVNNKRGTAANLEHKSEIRCSYCHDVHNTFGPSGRPYIRGAWGPNPYPEDMPPLSGYTYPTRGGPDTVANAGNGAGNRFQRRNATSGTSQIFPVGVPRLYGYTYTAAEIGAGEDLKGGFWIDKNSGNPPGSAPYNDTTFDTTNTFGGLCALCHTMGVDTLDYYRTSSLWQGTNNGHRNSTQGGAGSGGNNLFDARRSGGSGNYMTQQDAIQNFEWGKNSGYDSGSEGGWNSVLEPGRPCENNSGINCSPLTTGWYSTNIADQTRPAGDYNTWYGTGLVNNAHKFPCSKCHSPHATGLPALLITNCLDRNQASWSANSGRVGPGGSQQGHNLANNCHRKTSVNDGWHKLLPQQ